jgi:exocyst complex component 8
VRYKFQVQYPLDSLAVVNVRDLGNIKHAFKFLAFPDTRLFQCSSGTHKVLRVKQSKNEVMTKNML